jgi:hypothetical protein
MKRVFIAFLIFCLFLFSSAAFAARRALLVGIADYKHLPPAPVRDSPKCDLKGPINDVKVIKDMLVSSYGFSEHDIRVLTNESATKHAIDITFHEWLVNGTSEGDLVVFYFSGHGSRVEDFNGDEADSYDEVLLPYDMEPDGGYNMLIDDELGMWLRKLHDRRVVVIIDGCYSGGAIRGIRGETVSVLEDTPAWQGRFIPITNYTPSAIVNAIQRGADIPESVLFMAASGEHELALEVNFPKGFYGGFSFGLYDGMKSLQKPSYERLFEYAREVVKDRLELSQEPQMVARAHLIGEPAFGGEMLARKLEIVQPVAPPEVVGESVLVALEELEGSTPEEMRQLRESLAGLPIVELVEPDDFFDRLIRGEKKHGEYYVRLLNRIGDVEQVKPAATTNELVYRLKDHLEYACIVKQLARIHHPSPPFTITVWVTEQTRRDFRIGERIVFGVEAERDCYILLFNLDSQGNFHLIFPNKFHQDNFIKGNTTVLIPDEVMRSKFQFEFGPPTGRETVKVIATTEPLNLQALGLGNFSEAFQTISGKTRAIFVEEVIDTLSFTGFEWSEDTITIRSHE